MFSVKPNSGKISCPNILLNTFLRDGVKLDNQVQIAHNVEIGKNTVIAAHLQSKKPLKDESACK